MEDFGIEVINMEEMPGHPNSIFTRDMAVSTAEGYIKVRMGNVTRRGEEDWMAKFLNKRGEFCAGEIKDPGTVEGGDVLIAGSVAFVGITRRTNVDGVIQLSDILKTMGYDVRPVVLPSYYSHLDQVVGILGPERVICRAHLFPYDYFRGFEVFNINGRNHNVNLICLGEDKIITSASNSELIRAAEEAGVEVIVLDLSELVNGAVGPNCLIMPIKHG
jgi:dimethylargininase